MKSPKNPLRKWLLTQPREVNQSSIARTLGIDRSYASDLFAERCRVFPSLRLAFRIEAMTGGRVTARMLHDFIAKNRLTEEAEAA